MPNRILKESICTSDSINKLNAAADQLSNFVNSFSGITGLFGR